MLAGLNFAMAEGHRMVRFMRLFRLKLVREIPG
jgi:hypothetical protein